MNTLGIETRVGESVLYWVPAIHFRLAFSEEVNRLCASPDTRPDAIAVELGPETATATLDWLKDLGVGPTGRRQLPCMLGIIKRNCLLRPSYRPLAKRLQDLTGQDLNSFSHDLLKDLFNFSVASVLFLSPTDSIVEALRCALELGVPAYGVDLEDTAAAERTGALLPDLSTTHGLVDSYARRNARYAEMIRDPEIDERRERAMAARLKAILLEKKRRVVFTCGLAHWRPIQKLLDEPDLRPASVSQRSTASFHHILVHPLLAIYHMDCFPMFAGKYEERRLNASTRRSGTFDKINAPDLFRSMLMDAYSEHFKRIEPESQLDRSIEDWDACSDFERFLGNLCTLNQTAVPDLFTALLAAEGMMSRRFSETLARKLMEFDWATPDQHPGLPLVVPAPAEPGRAQPIQLIDSKGRRSPPFYIDTLPGGSGPTVQVEVPWQWPDEPDEEVEYTGDWRTWPPCDYLCAAMSVRAGQIAATRSVEPRVEVFEGSLFDGFDIKSILRAQVRGDDRDYVRDRRLRKGRPVTEDSDGSPVVWILRPGTDEESKFGVYSDEVDAVRSHVHDPLRLDSVARERGNILAWGVSFGVRKSPSDKLAGARIDRIALRGVLHYILPHFNSLQGTRWSEAMDFKRNPFYYGFPGDPNAFIKMCAARHGIIIDRDKWPVALVRMAIPYAETVVNVVAPDGFELPPVVREEAARRRVEVRVVPLSYFPREQLQKISVNYAVPRVAGDRGDEIPDPVGRILKENIDTNRRLVPRRLLYFGLSPAERRRAEH